MDAGEASFLTETEEQALRLFREDVIQLSGPGCQPDWPIQSIWAAMNHLRASVDPLDLREAGELNKLLHRIRKGIQGNPGIAACSSQQIARLYLPEIMRILPTEYRLVISSAVVPHLPSIEPSDRSSIPR